MDAGKKAGGGKKLDPCQHHSAMTPEPGDEGRTRYHWRECDHLAPKRRSRGRGGRFAEAVWESAGPVSELEEPDRPGCRRPGLPGVLLVGTTGIGRRVGRAVGGLDQIVGQEVILNLLARHVREHHPVDLDTRRKRLAGFRDHLCVIVAVVNDVDVLERQVVFAHDGAHAIGPAAPRFQVCFDVHDSLCSPAKRRSRGLFIRGEYKPFFPALNQDRKNACE